jgi:hypothetical protein
MKLVIGIGCLLFSCFAMAGGSVVNSNLGTASVAQADEYDRLQNADNERIEAQRHIDQAQTQQRNMARFNEMWATVVRRTEPHGVNLGCQESKYLTGFIDHCDVIVQTGERNEACRFEQVLVSTYTYAIGETCRDRTTEAVVKSKTVYISKLKH